MAIEKDNFNMSLNIYLLFFFRKILHVMALELWRYNAVVPKSEL